MIQACDVHGRTAYRRDDLPEVSGAEPPMPLKCYPETYRRMVLPRPRVLPDGSLWEAVARRRSSRSFAAGPLSGEDLFLLLWASQGITQPGRTPLRATPSAGATYPIETYLAVRGVEGLRPGLYHWQLPDEQLVVLAEDPAIGRRVVSACMDQSMCAEAACTFLWTAVFARTTARYGERGLRYVYLEAGHVGQSLLLAAAGLGLASCTIGALFDGEVNDLLGVDGCEESIIYAAAVGRPR